MPAIYAHIQFGEEVIALLPPAFREVKERFPETFYLGTQGPDILYYHKIMKKKKKNPVRKKGWDMHAVSPRKFLLNAANCLAVDGENYIELIEWASESAKKSAEKQETNAPMPKQFIPATAEAAYVIGFICHYMLDVACHPYIDSRSVNGLTHAKIESEFDKYQFRKVGIDPPRGFNAAALFHPSKVAKKTAAKMLEVPEKNIKRAMKSMSKFNRLFSHERESKHKFCHFWLKFIGKDDTYGDMFLHKEDDPRCAEINEGLAKIFEKAVRKASTAIRDYFVNTHRFINEEKIDIAAFGYNFKGENVAQLLAKKRKAFEEKQKQLAKKS